MRLSCSVRAKVRLLHSNGSALNLIAEESRTHTVLCEKYPHLRQIKCLQYLNYIILTVFCQHTPLDLNKTLCYNVIYSFRIYT